MTDQPEYGTLAPLVQAVGWLVSAAFAIGFSWRGRARWEPSEEDISQGPAKVGGMLTAVLVALIWSQMATTEYRVRLIELALWLAGSTLVLLLIYGLLNSTLVFEKVVAVKPNETAVRKVIGGFRFTERARKIKRTRHLTTQKLFAGAAYKEDEVWEPFFRGLAKGAFVLCYIGLTVSGSIALTCAAILLLLKQ